MQVLPLEGARLNIITCIKTINVHIYTNYEQFKCNYWISSFLLSYNVQVGIVTIGSHDLYWSWQAENKFSLNTDSSYSSCSRCFVGQFNASWKGKLSISSEFNAYSQKIGPYGPEYIFRI